MIETKVRQWQQKCYLWMKGKAKAEGEGDFRSAHESALEIPKSSSLDFADCNEQAGEWRQLPCPIIFEGGYPGNVRKLGQSQNGLLDYLPRLPQEVRVAFQRHIDRARAALDNADWEKAILEFQGCRDILKFSKKVVEKEVFDCLLVWVDLPLVKLYQCHVEITKSQP